jgi:hypothetical protein
MARTLSVAWVLAGASAARADSMSVLAQPGFSASRTSTSSGGRTTEQESTELAQQYRLSLDRTVFPHLGFSGTGLFAKDLVWLRQDHGPTTRSDDTAANLSSRLTLGTGLLGGALSYDRRQERAPGTGGDWAVANTYGLTAGWHPQDLPKLDLRLSRADEHDPSAASPDGVTYDALATLDYGAVRDLDLRYTLRFTDASRGGIDTTSVSQDARATWRGTVLEGRTTAYASAGITSVWSTTTSAGPNGAVPTQRFPVAGLSLVEDFPAVPETDVLLANPALVNGDVASSAAVNLGTSNGAADRRPRDLGVQLADAVTKVNRVRVWVRNPLPPAVSSAFTWSAYRSDDGQHWTPVALAGAPTFGVLENRFDVPIVETAARYLKVVTLPLAPAVTTDPRYADVLVTELQLFDDLPVSQLRRDATRVAETLSASAQTRLWGSPNLTHDVSVSLIHPTDGTPGSWLLVNGLSLTGRATPTLTLSGRVASQEADAGTGRTHGLQWSATAAHRPLPTISDGLTYGGQLTSLGGRLTLTNTLAGYGRAEVYQGIAATANASYAVTSVEAGASTRAATASAGTAIVPNRVLSLAATYGVAATQTTGGATPDSSTTRHHADVTATVTPVPALYASAGVTRTFGDAVRAATLAHLSLNLSPFPDGQLVARLTYSDTVDTSADSRTRMLSPTLRWTLRPGMFLDATFTDLRTQAPLEASHTETASLNLTIAL